MRNFFFFQIFFNIYIISQKDEIVQSAPKIKNSQAGTVKVANFRNLRKFHKVASGHVKRNTRKF